MDFSAVIQLCIFADNFEFVRLLNASLTLFYQEFTSTWALPNAIHASLVYEKTGASSPIRRLLVDIVADQWNFDSLASERMRWPQEFLADLLVRLKKTKRSPGDPPAQPARWVALQNQRFCKRYHYHAPVGHHTGDTTDEISVDAEDTSHRERQTHSGQRSNVETTM